MSIRDKASSHGNTVTSVNRALELFTDRDEFTCLFARYLNEDPAPEKILFFHGGGGNGKTLLLEYLRKNCCKRFRRDIWRQISKQMGYSKADAAETIASTIDNQLIKPIPAIIHDFGLPPIGNNRPQDPLYGLLMLRRNLAREAKKCGYQLKFPLFDFACLAKREFTEAIAAYDRALTLAPDDIEVLNNKGLALISLGNLYDELSEEKAAIKCWQAALDSFSHSLKIAPSDRYIQNLRDELLVFLNDNP